MAHQLFGDHRGSAHEFPIAALYAPGHGGEVARQPPVHLALHVLHDLGAPQRPPLLGGRHRFAVLEGEDVRENGIRIRQRLVIVRVVHGRCVGAGARPQDLDPQLLHHVLVVLLGGERRRRLLGDSAGCEGEDEEERELVPHSPKRTRRVSCS